MNRIIKSIWTHLEDHGYKGQIVSIHHLQEIQRDVEGRYRQGLLDNGFYRERLSFFKFKIPKDLPATSSIIIVAVPRPQVRVIFNLNNVKLALILPPTYVGYKTLSQYILKVLSSILVLEGLSAGLASLPLKILSVQSGLGEYGRNNICYVPGMGSFLQLVAVYTNLPCEEDNWRPPHMMERCQECQACLKKCPTKAIDPDRFLLHAERCLVFHNEKPGGIPFPAWIDPKWHDCLVGCMHCQRVCPENKKNMKWIEGDEEFNEKETKLLINGISVDRLPPKTRTKLERLDLIDSLDALPRNLGVFFERLGG